MLIDTHSHIYVEHFKEDIDAAMSRCLANDVRKIVLPNIDLDSISQVEQLCSAYPTMCFPAMGVHPCSINADWERVLAEVKNYIDHQLHRLPNSKIYGIGEIGLDYYWDTTFKMEQQAALRTQIEWAKELQLPIILHSRNSFDDLFAIVAEMNDPHLSGIFHCFGGTLEGAEKIMALGNFYVGIGGVLTYKNNQPLRDVMKEVPLEYIVLETDSPYLPPVPFRGKRNESSYLLNVAEMLASVKQVGLDEIAKITSQNASSIFGLK
jgi:TatD DNase family protein